MNTRPGNKYRLEDLIDIKQFQDLQDRLNEIYSFPSSILDNDGNILTATGWQDICTKFHRKNKECEKVCIQSDKYISEHLNEADPAVTYQCPHGLLDSAVPIVIDGVHYGNFFTGQFFLEKPDMDFFREQAEKYGFPEGSYLEAVKKVPIWSREQLKSYLLFIKGLITILSESGLKNLKEAEARKQIEEGKELHRTILQTTIDGYMQIDKNGNLVEVNDAYCKMSGYSRDELLMMNAGKLEATEPSPELKEKINELVEKKTHRFIRQHRKKDGTIFDVEISSQYLPELEVFVCLIRDFTKRKQLEESLSASLERLDLATNAAQLGIWDWDLENENLIWDDGMYSLYRIQKEGLRNLYESWLDSIHPDDRDDIIDLVDRAKENDLKYDTEYRIFWPDGTIRHIKTVGKIIKNSDGDAVRMIGVSYDITKSKEMESQLQQAQKMESIGTLAGGIAHDFNNILSPIMMHAEMAMMDLPPDNPLQHCMKEIIHSGQRARDLVKQILTFARKRSEKRILLKSSLIIKEAVKFLRSTIPTTININYDNRTKNDTILADPTQLNQIIMNLCTNAAYAMREKGGLLEIILDEEDIPLSKINRFPTLNPGSYVRLTIKDDGTGISPEILDRIFEPYYTTKKVGEGTGLGLAIVHGIVQNYGGDIIVESKVNHGSAFHVYLPFIKAESSSDEEYKVEIQKGTEKILIVDDEKAAIHITKRMLEKFGYKVTSTTNSRDALEIFQNSPGEFDLVITDMTMPDITGEVLAKEIKTISPETPVILCTGFSDNINEEKAKKIGISHFILKPIVMSELAKTIREVLDWGQ